MLAAIKATASNKMGQRAAKSRRVFIRRHVMKCFAWRRKRPTFPAPAASSEMWRGIASMPRTRRRHARAPPRSVGGRYSGVIQPLVAEAASMPALGKAYRQILRCRLAASMIKSWLMTREMRQYKPPRHLMFLKGGEFHAGAYAALMGGGRESWATEMKRCCHLAMKHIER